MTTTHRITTTAAVMLSLAAAAGAPAASARPADIFPPTHQSPASVYSRHDKSMIPVAAPASAPRAVVRIQTPPNGFDWGDAGIGAASGLALAMIGVGGALAVSQRGRRRGTTLSS